MNRFRRSRDEYLIGNPLGEKFIDLYYGGAGEKVAEYLEDAPEVKEYVRDMLDGVASMLESIQEDWNPAEYEPSEDWLEYGKSFSAHSDIPDHHSFTPVMELPLQCSLDQYQSNV